MAERRWKDQKWHIATEDGKQYMPINPAQHLAVLMDIRDELQALNRLLSCPNFVEIPFILREIKRNTRKKPKAKAKGKPKLRIVGGSRA